MSPCVHECRLAQLARSRWWRSFAAEPGLVLLRSAVAGGDHGRYSICRRAPFLDSRSARRPLRVWGRGVGSDQFGNPWTVLEPLIARYELLDELDLPFPWAAASAFGVMA